MDLGTAKKRGEAGHVRLFDSNYLLDATIYGSVNCFNYEG
jgi:hypothetical protein